MGKAKPKTEQTPVEELQSSGGHSEAGGQNLVGMLKAFTQETSMHGLGRVVSSRYVWLRAVWALFVLAGASVTAYNVINVILNFYTYPVATVVSLEYASTLRFPAVTICNLNMLRRSQWENNVHLKKLRDYYYDNGSAETTPASTGSTPDYNYDYGDFFDEEEVLQSDYKIRVYMASMNKTIRKNFSHQMEDMLIDCNYFIFNCSAQNFTQFYSGKFGNCYTFNKDSGANVVTKPGPFRGLKLLLNTEEDEYMQMTSTTGFKVVVHPQNTMPFPEDEGVMVSPGFTTNIAISKLDIKQAEAPYGHCVNYSKDAHYELNMYSAEYGVGYSDKACRMTCYQTEVFDRCGCCDRDYPCLLTSANGMDLNAEYCNYSWTADIQCVDMVYQDFINDNLLCGDRCKPACKEVSYTTEVSTGRWPSNSTIRIYQSRLRNHRSTEGKTVDHDYVRYTIAHVNIYFKQLNYQQIETSPAYDWSRLLSDLGGQFGLWLGFSLLTAMEIVQLLFEIFQHLIARPFGRGSKTKPENSAVSIRHIN